MEQPRFHRLRAGRRGDRHHTIDQPEVDGAKLVTREQAAKCEAETDLPDRCTIACDDVLPQMRTWVMRRSCTKLRAPWGLWKLARWLDEGRRM